MVTYLKQEYGQAGVKLCLLTFYQPEAAVHYTTPEKAVISSLGLSFEAGRSVLVEGVPGSSLSETPTAGVNGPQYAQVVNMANAGLSAEKRTLFDSINRGGRVHALVQDSHGMWWFCGQVRGLRLSYKTDTEAGLVFSLFGREADPARLVAPALIPDFLTFLN